MSSATSIEKRSFRLKPEVSNTKRGQKTGPPKGHDGFRPQAEETDAQADNGFRPWHFFVLASLMLATVAVVMSRRATPEHLVLISFTIAAAGAASAGFYRMLAPLASEDVSMFSEPMNERSRAAIEREKTLVIRSIKELEFDRAMGKLSPKDFDEMGGRLRARAIMLMKQLDEGSSVYRELIERELNARLVTAASAAASRAYAAAPAHEAGFWLKPEATEVESGPGAQPEVGDAELDSRGPGLQPEVSRATTAGACASCGTTNDHDAAFCKRCGTGLHEVRS
jgi:hypothetical protein